MGIDRAPEIADLVKLRTAWGRPGRRGLGLLMARQRGRLPGTVERIEHDVADRFGPVAPAIDRALDHVAKLADIARPLVFLQRSHRRRGKAGPGIPMQFGCHAPPEVIGQHADIAFAHPQGWQGDNLEAEPVEQVGAEPALLGQAWQVLVGRGDNSHIDLDRTRRADPRDLAIFDRAQQPFLRAHRQRRQFVEE